MIDDKLQRSVLFAFSAVALGINACDLLNNLMLQTFLLDYANIAPTYAGLISTISQIVEILGSTFIGKFSDKTNSKFGKRRPWILAGSILTSGAIVCMFISVPEYWNESERVVYYVFIIIWYSITFPATTIPHEALAAEITSDYDQRLQLSTWAMAMSFAGQLVMIVCLFLLFTLKADRVLGIYVWVLLAGFPGLTTLVFGFITFAMVPTQDDTNETVKIESATCLKSLRLFSIPSFVCVILIFSLVGQVSSLSLSLMPLYIKHSIGFGLDTFSQIAIVMMGSTVITIYILNHVGKFFEKKTILNFGCILGILAYLGFFFVPGFDETNFNWTRYFVFPLAGLSGVSSAITYTLPLSMMADVTDVAFYKFKSKQEGFMFSVMETVQSVIQAFGGFLIGLRLDAVGYSSDGEQTETVKLELRFLFCTIPIAVYLVVWVLGAIYPINRATHLQLLKKIQSLRGIEQNDTGFFANTHGGLVAGAQLEGDKTLNLKRNQYDFLQRKQTQLNMGVISGDSDVDIEKKIDSDVEALKSGGLVL